MIWTAPPAKAVPILVSPRLYHSGVHCQWIHRLSPGTSKSPIKPRGLLLVNSKPSKSLTPQYSHHTCTRRSGPSTLQWRPGQPFPSVNSPSWQNLTALHEASPCCQAPNVLMGLKGLFHDAFNCSFLIAHTCLCAHTQRQTVPDLYWIRVK